MPLLRLIPGYSRTIQVIWISQRFTNYDHIHKEYGCLGYNTSVHTFVEVELIFIILGLNIGWHTSWLNLRKKGVITVIYFVNNSICVRQNTLRSLSNNIQGLNLSMKLKIVPYNIQGLNITCYHKNTIFVYKY